MSGFCLPQITPSLKSSPWLCLQKCWRDLPESHSLWLVRKAFPALGSVVKKTCTKLWSYWCIDPAPHEFISKGCDVGLRNVDQVIFSNIYSSHKEWFQVIPKCLEEKAQNRISSLTSVIAICLSEPKPSLQISTYFASVIPFPPWYPLRNDSSLYLSSDPLKLPFLLTEPWWPPFVCWPNVGGVTRNLNYICSVRDWLFSRIPVESREGSNPFVSHCLVSVLFLSPVSPLKCKVTSWVQHFKI